MTVSQIKAPHDQSPGSTRLDGIAAEAARRDSDQSFSAARQLKKGLNSTSSQAQLNATNIDQVNTAINTTNSNLGTTNAALTTLQATVTSQGGQISSIETHQTTQDGEITTLNSEVAALTTHQATQDGEISTLTTDVAGLTSHQATQDTEIATLTTDVAALPISIVSTLPTAAAGTVGKLYLLHVSGSDDQLYFGRQMGDSTYQITQLAHL